MVPTDLQHSNTVHDMLWDDHVEGSSAGVLTYSLVGGTAVYVASVFSCPLNARGGLVGDAVIAAILLPCNLRSSSDLHTST